MKKLQYVLGMIACCIIMILSCSKSNDVSSSALLPELVQAEEIMYESPDSALHILQTMPAPQPSDKLQYATWALFMTQAKYKLYMNQSDSLINIAYDFFKQKKDPQRKALVLYYKASLYKEHKEIEKAQDYYLKAIECIQEIEDYQLSHLIYSGIGGLYLYRDLIDYAIDSYEKAYEYGLKSKNKRAIIASCIYLGRVYDESNENEKAIAFFNEAISISDSINEYEMKTSAMNDLANVYNKLHDYSSALYYIKQSIYIRKKQELNVSDQLYLTIAHVYQKMNKLDSAYWYTDKVLNSKNVYVLENAYVTLYNLYQKEEKYRDAVISLKNAWIYNDSIQRIDKSKSLIEMQEKYNQQKIINEKNEIELKKNRLIHKILVVLVLLILMIASIVYKYQKAILKKERMIQEAEENIRMKSLQIQENELTINRNQNRMSYLIEEIDKNSDMLEQLEEQKLILSKMRKKNDDLTKKNLTLQSDIDKISHILKQKTNEIKTLKELSKENSYLHDREKFLSKIIIQKYDVLNILRTNPKYIETAQWEIIKDTIDYLFDDYTKRLSKLVPTLTDSDIQICCLIKLQFSNPTIATLLAISSTSVTKRKMRLKERILSKIGSFDDYQTLDIWLWDF